MKRHGKPIQVPLPPPVPEGAVFVRIDGLKTKNPNNNSQGFSKNWVFARAREKKHQRMRASEAVQVMRLSQGKLPEPPWTVTITRVAPSSGLDPWDGLGAALKGCIDGVADALGLKNDRDPVVTWRLEQMRGPPRYYAVEVLIESRAARAATQSARAASLGPGRLPGRLTR